MSLLFIHRIKLFSHVRYVNLNSRTSELAINYFFRVSFREVIRVKFLFGLKESRNKHNSISS